MRASIDRVRVTIGLLGLLLALAGCGGSASPPSSYPPGAIVVTAQNQRFNTSELIVPADQKFWLVLVNEDADMHNIAIRTKRGFDGDLVFRHDPISTSTIVLEVGPIAKGAYHFICEVQPAITGTVLAQ